MNSLFSTSVLRAVIRSGLIAALVYTGARAGDLVEFFFLCHGRELAQRAASGEPVVVTDSGFAYARPFDEILLCRMKHCLRAEPHTISCHEDLACLCVDAKAASDPREMDRRFKVRGMRPIDCTVDKAHPTRQDAEGACRYAHCDDHLAP